MAGSVSCKPFAPSHSSSIPALRWKQYRVYAAIWPVQTVVR